MTNELSRINRGVSRNSCRIECRAESLVAPHQNRFMHLIKDCELTSASVALLQVLAKIARIRFAGLAIKIRDQVFSPMTDWSFIHFLHVKISPQSYAAAIAKFLQTHL